MNKGVALVVAEVDLGTEHVGVNVVACAVLAVIAAIEVSSDPNFLIQVESSGALPTVVVNGISAVTGVKADERISAGLAKDARRQLSTRVAVDARRIDEPIARHIRRKRSRSISHSTHPTRESSRLGLRVNQKSSTQEP